MKNLKEEHASNYFHCGKCQSKPNYNNKKKGKSFNRSISLPLDLEKTVLKSDKLKRKIEVNKNIVTGIENGILKETPYEHIYTHSNFWLYSSDEEIDEKDNIYSTNYFSEDENGNKGIDEILRNFSACNEFDHLTKISNFFKTFKYIDPNYKFFGYFGF